MTTEHKNLTAALLAASAAVRGCVYKAGANYEQKYRYVGHEDVLVHVRSAMEAHGIVVVPLELRFVDQVRYPSKSGERVVFLWEQKFEVAHAHSDDKRIVTVQVSTNANDKTAFVASTAADRTLLMRLLRLAGTDEENPEHDSHNERDQRQQNANGRAQQARQQGNGNGQRPQQGANVPQLIATLANELKAVSDFEQLVSFYRHARQQLHAAGANEQQRTGMLTQWGQRCQALGFVPKEVADAANRRAA